MTTIVTENEKQTIDLAKTLTEYLEPGMTILLDGDLGAGKTTFTKGIGAALGVKRIIKSPTYTIVREYQDGKFPLYHIDLYRLEESEVEDLGLDEYFEGAGVSVVEWPSIAPDDLPLERLELALRVNPSEPEKREITLTGRGEKYKKVIEAMKKG